MADDVLIETEEQALARIGRRAQASANPYALMEVALPTETQSIAITQEEHRELVEGQLFIGFANKSGRIPEPADFIGDDESRDYWRQRLGYRRMLGSGEAVSERVALVPLHRRIKHHRDGTKGDPTLRAELTWDVTSWVTHAIIGSKKFGVIATLEFNTPYPVKPGNRFKLGIKLSDLLATRRMLDAACDECDGRGAVLEAGTYWEKCPKCGGAKKLLTDGKDR